jgi:hypothetical protein
MIMQGGRAECVSDAALQQFPAPAVRGGLMGGKEEVRRVEGR